jgi:predicted ABC-class ATPase
MQSSNQIRSILQKIDGRGYKAYKELEGHYDFTNYQIFIDHAQSDPFAPPSCIRIWVPQSVAGFPKEIYQSRSRKIALEDFLTRRFAITIRALAKGHRGIGKSGLISIDTPHQQVLLRTSMVINSQGVEARLVVGLPAAGRTVLAKEAAEIFFHELPAIIQRALIYNNLDDKQLQRHIEIVEDQEVLRQQLKENHLVAFIANGSVLPRMSGVDDRPLTNAVALQSPPEMEIELVAPNRGIIRGMGIPEGITLIIGGGFHGKSTFLTALERSVYNQIPGDGREYVVTRVDALKIRAENGRYIEKVDISPFISNLPLGKDTVRFSTENASGSTSQAANIMEALEVGSRLLLIDEDTSATNFMIRDVRMQRLVSKDKEPITPFIDKVEQLYKELEVSTILVMGGSGDYFDVATKVIMMDQFLPRDVTTDVKDLLNTYPAHRSRESGENFGTIRYRKPLPGSFVASRGKREVKIDAKGLQTILFGQQSLDLTGLEQLVDFSQTRAIGEMIYYYSQHFLNATPDLYTGLREMLAQIEEKGLDIISPFKSGNFALPRIYELAGAINRLRSLVVKSNLFMF